MSICHVIVIEKCQRKVESRAMIPDHTQKTNTVGGWGVSRGHVAGQTTAKTGKKKSFGAVRSPGLALFGSIIKI